MGKSVKGFFLSAPHLSVSRLQLMRFQVLLAHVYICFVLLIGKDDFPKFPTQ